MLAAETASHPGAVDPAAHRAGPQGAIRLHVAAHPGGHPVRLCLRQDAIRNRGIQGSLPDFLEDSGDLIYR